MWSRRQGLDVAQAHLQEKQVFFWILQLSEELIV